MSRAYIRKVAKISSTPRLIFGYRNAVPENQHKSSNGTILPFSTLTRIQLQGISEPIDNRSPAIRPYLGISLLNS